mmetsp:Transcript_17033/g.46786  ORF Transcript_17033/g.46786 Transcript_17033/m.46786 type:complete len:209 (-) Transcript_17033:2428-3054(-)
MPGIPPRLRDPGWTLVAPEAYRRPPWERIARWRPRQSRPDGLTFCTQCSSCRCRIPYGFRPRSAAIRTAHRRCRGTTSTTKRSRLPCVHSYQNFCRGFCERLTIRTNAHVNRWKLCGWDSPVEERKEEKPSQRTCVPRWMHSWKKHPVSSGEPAWVLAELLVRFVWGAHGPIWEGDPQSWTRITILSFRKRPRTLHKLEFGFFGCGGP